MNQLGWNLFPCILKLSEIFRDRQAINPTHPVPVLGRDYSYSALSEKRAGIETRPYR